MTNNDGAFGAAMMDPAEVEVEDEMKSVKRLNNRVKIGIILAVGAVLLLVMIGFGQVNKRQQAVISGNVEDEELAEGGEGAQLPADLRDTEPSGIIPAERPVPGPQELTLDTRDVPVIIPDANGEFAPANNTLAGPSTAESEIRAEHRNNLLQAELDHDLERRRYFLSRNMQAIKNKDDTDKIAASSSMEITLGVNEVDNLLLGQGGAGSLPGSPASRQLLGAASGLSSFPTGAAPVAPPSPLDPAAAQMALIEAVSGGQQGPGGGLGLGGGGGLFGPTGGGSGESYASINGQAGKNAFAGNVQDAESEDYLDRYLRDPLSPYELKQGSIIPGVMVTGINSDLPGRIVGQVSQNVYDTTTGSHLLIPQGTRLFGRYDSSVTPNQKRVLIVWTRLIYPNGKAINIANMAGSDQGGQSGLRDKVNNHTFSLYSQAVLLSLVGGGINALTNDEGDIDELTRAIRRSSRQNLEDVTAKVLDRGLDRQPTLTIRPGKSFVILVDQDIILEPYQAQRSR